ncbi:TIGR03862 family flavoprotein [Coraliomargarita algicola]|uniref:TIGR03862 family flavoprotein n=1 Tax=Coraliomargarita algicola TaxID=3092156 RepID=A0ABZ0RMS1_9BACT|nr:TIGR03862 family flavoprotein [Coraliomargarita sp. J2-16]WPJ96065.1 TIGR03862 family flavoprotein [Coraliomargarita sp. J2-16]
MDNSRREIAIIGGGPAGLRAAEVAARRGAAVTVFDAKPSVGRKFLVAGRSGLNLTNSADFETFLAQYSGRDFPVERWREYLKDFDNYHLSDWAAELGVDTFAASSGKVFPFSKKAAPLLRRWVLRLRELGVVFRMKHQWTGLAKQPDGRIQIDCLQGDQPVQARFDAVVLAMGGASWPQTGSTGSWVSILEAQGVEVVPLAAANCGWECDWSPETRAQIEGKPLQNLKLSANGRTLTGELVATRYGFEGTPLYTLGRELRRMASPVIEIDFKPTLLKRGSLQKWSPRVAIFIKRPACVGN